MRVKYPRFKICSYPTFRPCARQQRATFIRVDLSLLILALRDIIKLSTTPSNWDVLTLLMRYPLICGLTSMFDLDAGDQLHLISISLLCHPRRKLAKDRCARRTSCILYRWFDISMLLAQISGRYFIYHRLYNPY